MKYIILGNDNFEYPIIFPDNLPHICVSESICNNPEFSKMKLKPISAGFIDLGSVKCSDKSETLELESRPQDTSLINTFWITHGIKGMV